MHSRLKSGTFVRVSFVREVLSIKRRVFNNLQFAVFYPFFTAYRQVFCHCMTESRRLSGRRKSMSAFGLQFHRSLLENQRDETADAVQRDPERFCRACEALGGRKTDSCDIGYAVELFDGLDVVIQFWYGDEEFFPRLRYLWDENALQYLRYETMFYAVNVLWDRLRRAAD